MNLPKPHDAVARRDGQKAQRIDLVLEVVSAMTTREEVMDVADHGFGH